MATVPLNSSAGKWIMTSCIMASAMAFIDGTALNVVLPALQNSLHATGTDLFWILNAYLLMLAALILIGGSMGDRLGRKKVFMIGIFIFIAGSAACGVAPNVTLLILFRIIQGIGSALMIPGSLSLISSSINEDERGKAIGTWSAVTTFVTIGGPILGGALADAGLWRYIFFINIPIGIIALLILWREVKESRDEKNVHRLDFTGAFAIAFGLALLTYGFLRIPVSGFDHWQVYVSLIAGLLLLIIFLIIENKSKYPMMPLTLFKIPAFTGTNLLTFFLYAGLGAAMLFLSLNLVQIQGYSQLQSGLTFLPFSALMISLARYAGSLADRHGPRMLLIAGPALAGLGFLILSFTGQTNGPEDYWTSFFPGMVVLGLGMSLTVAPLTATVMAAVSDQFSGTASGVNNAVSRIAGVFANAIFGALAFLFFTAALQTDLKMFPITTGEKQEVMAQVVNLGNARLPDNINPDLKIPVEKLYRDGFIDAYSRIMKISAILAFLASLMALLFIKDNKITASLK